MQKRYVITAYDKTPEKTAILCIIKLDCQGIKDYFRQIKTDTTMDVGFSITYFNTSLSFNLYLPPP